MTRLALVLVLAAACGGSSKHTVNDTARGSNTEVGDQIPTTKGPECAIVADKLATVSHADEPDRQAEARDRLRIRCTEDRWSDDARSCFATVENDDEISGCASKLTAAQRSSAQIAGASPADAASGGGATTKSLTGGSGADSKGGGNHTRGPVNKTSSDPCEGGEATSSDPQEGGQHK
jgi:hypothetical protein